MKGIIADIVFFCKEKKTKMTFFAGKRYAALLLAFGSVKHRGLFLKKLALSVKHSDLRAREPRPYLDKNKQVPNIPAGLVGAKCQGRGGVSPPGIFFSRMLKKQAVDSGWRQNQWSLSSPP